MWRENAEQVGVTNYVVSAFKDSYDKAVEEFGGNHTFAAEPVHAKVDNGVKLSVLARLRAVVDILELGVGCTLIDIDAMIVRDPTPLLLKYPEADILATSDGMAASDYGASHDLEDPFIMTYDFNIGFCWFKANRRTLAFIRTWRDLYLKNDRQWDQRLFGEVLRNAKHPFDPPGKYRPVNGTWAVEGLPYGLYPFFNRTVVVGMLSSVTFRNGFALHGSLWERYDKLDRLPYVVHPTAHQDKEFAAREQLAGGTSPLSYYNDPAGYLTFDLNIPELGVGPGSSVDYKMVRKNLRRDISLQATTFWRALLNKQLVQIGQAIAIARMMKRVLVLPPLIVPTVMHGWLSEYAYQGDGADRSVIWSSTSVWLINHHHVVTHDYISLREYSFMHNPMVPREVRHSVKQMPHRRLNETTAKALGVEMANREDARVVHFNTTEGSFAFDEGKNDREEFRRGASGPFFRRQKARWMDENDYSFSPAGEEMDHVANLSALLAEAVALYGEEAPGGP